MTERILTSVRQYYADKILEHGASAKGVDWNGSESQYLRFRQLGTIIPNNAAECVVHDLGCGYGAFLDYLLQCSTPCRYRGFDVTPEMVEAARKYWLNREVELPFEFLCSHSLEMADCTVASGIFNVKNDIEEADWLEYILRTLQEMHQHSRIAWAANFLTKYSDAEAKKPYLYYADPCWLFDYCKRNFSRQVALLHDYGLYEFTLLVRCE